MYYNTKDFSVDTLMKYESLPELAIVIPIQQMDQFILRSSSELTICDTP